MISSLHNSCLEEGVDGNYLQKEPCLFKIGTVTLTAPLNVEIMSQGYKGGHKAPVVRK